MKSRKSNPLYPLWSNMIARCHNPKNPNFKRYGAKGIIVCEWWHDFDNFVFDIENHLPNGHLLYQKGYELDKDLKGGNIYSLGNCVVLTKEKNRRIARKLQQKPIYAISMNDTIRFSSISEAGRILKINRGSIQQHLKKGAVHASGYYFDYL